MSAAFPYTYYSCPCTDSVGKASNRPDSSGITVEDEEERTFDPHSPKANFSLFPLEHLLYCTECQHIRCPRCITEEVVCWYCPSCLFEVPSSTVRSEGNRCNRSCLNCPLCTSPLTVSSFVSPSEQPSEEGPSGPFILCCPYCNWTSLDIGIKFDSAKNISGQLQKIKNGGQRIQEQSGLADSRVHPEKATAAPEGSAGTADAVKDRYPTTEEETFWRLSQFYKTQIAESEDGIGYGSGGMSDISFASPSAVARLLSMYSNVGKRSRKNKPSPMRESLTAGEGLEVLDFGSEDAIIERMRTEGLEGLSSQEQRLLQDKKYDARFIDEMRPVATLLRTKRSKRCRACRTLLSRPEPKVSSTRYKIKVLALNNIPKVTMRPLNAQGATAGASSAPQSLLAYTAQAAALRPLLTHQFLLTITNPLFDPIRVTLATPPVTPGRIQTRVTILCPQFDVGANSDIWDEALGTAGSKDAGKHRSSGSTSQVPSSAAGAPTRASGPEDSRTAEAGKIWDRGRNWTSVVVEVVPGVLPGTTGSLLTTTNTAAPTPKPGDGQPPHATAALLSDDIYADSADEDEDALDEDEDLLEIPILVRLEYDAEPAAGEEHRATAAAATATAAAREKREIAFWCVVGAGRIAA